MTAARLTAALLLSLGDLWHLRCLLVRTAAGDGLGALQSLSLCALFAACSVAVVVV